MNKTNIEHINIIVSDVDKTAALYERIFGWQVRWKDTTGGDMTKIHVGIDSQYLALCPLTPETSSLSYAGLNHIGVVVDDLEVTEKLIKTEGLVPHSHEDYEPGRRFYFNDSDGIGYEVVSYSK